MLIDQKKLREMSNAIKSISKYSKKPKSKIIRSNSTNKPFGYPFDIPKKSSKSILSPFVTKIEVPIKNVEVAVDTYRGRNGRDGRDGRDGKNGKDGEKGDPGKNGITPIAGVDFFIPEEETAESITRKINTLKNAIEGYVINGYVEPTELIKLVLKELKTGTNRLNVKDITGLPQPGTGYKLSDQRWHGAGVTSLTAGTNVTITADGNGGYTISASGGGTGGTVAVEIPVGTIDGINATFTVTYLPLWIVLNQQTYFEGFGYTRSAGTITIDSSIIPPVGSILRSINQGSSVTTGNVWLGETPSGTINGVNKTFTLSGSPISNSLCLFWNGQYLTAGGVDYTLSGTTITLVTAPQVGEVLTSHYATTFSGTFYQETPSGTLNGINVTFTLAHTPDTNSLSYYWNGQLLSAGGVDYTLSGTTITMATAPGASDVVTAEYTSGSTTSWKQETPSGTINGVNTSFTLASTPASNALTLYLNGQFLTGGGVDYTLSGATAVLVSAPLTGSVLTAIYQ